MPTAPDELRAKMLAYFGDEIDDAGPEAFLRGHGWMENRWCWHAPLGRAITDKEWDCMDFLIQEWDHDYSAESVRCPTQS